MPRVERMIVAERYVGRHRRAELALAAAASGSARKGAAFRPLLHAGASVALASAAVGGYLTAGGPSASGGVTLADPALASAQSGQPLTGLIADVPTAFDASGAGAEIAQANRDRVDRLVTVAAANDVAAAAAAAEVARLDAERQAAAQRAARDAQRASVLANAQRDPKAVAALLVADRGWSSAQFGCLVKLWTKESNWRWNADNPTSSAYGIPQALPGSKMASAGSDWRTNPATQIKWGIGYIASRYGTPCSAWSHSVNHNWY
jgi:hypothetical protein